MLQLPSQLFFTGTCVSQAPSWVHFNGRSLLHFFLDNKQGEQLAIPGHYFQQFWNFLGFKVQKPYVLCFQVPWQTQKVQNASLCSLQVRR